MFYIETNRRTKMTTLDDLINALEDTDFNVSTERKKHSQDYINSLKKYNSVINVLVTKQTGVLK